MYDIFARYYDVLMQDATYKQRAKRICALLSSFGVAAHATVLDLACGTGSITQLLAAQGYAVIGADQSVEMLTLAQQKCWQAGRSPLFIQQRMQDLELHCQIDAAVCLLDSFNHLPTWRDAEKALARLAKYLRPGGSLLFDVNTIYKHQKILGNTSFVKESQDVLCLWQNEYEYASKSHAVNITLDFFVPQGNNSYLRYTEEFSEHAWPLEDWKEALQQNGFQLHAVYDDLSVQPAGKRTQRALFVAQKL